MTITGTPFFEASFMRAGYSHPNRVSIMLAPHKIIILECCKVPASIPTSSVPNTKGVTKSEAEEL